jgi:hypothetical protein
VTGNHPNYPGKNKAFENSVDDVLDLYDVTQRGKESGKRDVDARIGAADERTPKPPTKIAKITSIGKAAAIAINRGSTR